MNKHTRHIFNPKFKPEAAQRIVDQNYTIQDAAESIGVGKSTLDKRVRQLRLFKLPQPLRCILSGQIYN